MNEPLKEVEGPLYPSKGRLIYSDNFRLVVEINVELAAYYRSLMPKYKSIQPQRYPPHITVVRTGREEPPNKEFWRKYEGREVEFLYSPVVHEGTVYYWLNTFSVSLEMIRLELGLPVHSEYTRPPESFIQCFHATIGNKKG